MTKVEGLNDFFDTLDRLEKAFRKLPNEMAVISVRFSKERFRQQNWLDKQPAKWSERKRKRPGKRRSQTLLVDTGRLKRSIRKIHVSQSKIIIGTDVPYAQIHNDGGTIKQNVTVKKHNVKSHRRKSYTRNRAGRSERIKATTVSSHSVGSHKRKMNITIKQRQFIGDSYTLSNQLINHAKTSFDKAINK